MTTKTPRPSTRNITAAYRAATDTDRADGVEWYGRARRLAEELATNVHGVRTQHDVGRAAAVIAVLSPRLSWSKNVEYARRAYAHWAIGRSDVFSREAFVRELPVLNANADKAWRILSGENPEDVVSGPKVRAFWHTICDPSDPRAVVVDRHAFDIACGRVLGETERGILLGRAGAYDTVCDLYRRAAKIVSREFGQEISPAVLQATTWVYWRRSRAGRGGAQGTLEIQP